MAKKQYLTSGEVVKILDISHPTFLKMVASGEIRGTRDESRKRSPWYIPIAEVKTTIDKKQVEVDKMRKRLLEALETPVSQF